MSFIPISERHTPERYGGLAEILDHPQWLRHLAHWIEPTLYVEYGVHSGKSLEQIAPLCQRAWGVDLAPYESRAPNYTHHQMSTRDFYSSVLNVQKPVIDLAFIDACHESDVVVQDFADLFPFIAENGFIVLHDTYPIRKEFTVPTACSDCWKVPARLRAKYGAEIELLTLPFMPGLTMVRKCTRRAEPNWVQPIDQYSFTNDWFENQRPIIERFVPIPQPDKCFRILEIGVFEGRGSVFYSDRYLDHPKSCLIMIDPFDTQDSTCKVSDDTYDKFRENIRQSKNALKCTHYRQTSKRMLTSMANSGRKFDFISIDGSHKTADVLMDAVLAFELLADGGVLFFDDYLQVYADDAGSGPAIDAFLACYKNDIDVLYKEYHVVVRRVKHAEQKMISIHATTSSCKQ